MVLQKVKEKEEMEEQKRKAIEDKKQMQQQSAGARFRLLYQKYTSNTKLVATDYRNLIRKVQQIKDSPVKSKLEDLKAQWHRRKHRFDDFITNNINNDVTTCNVDAEYALITNPVQVPVVSLPEQVGGGENNFVAEPDGSANLFLHMLQKINSDSDAHGTAEI
jgi:hypothetical protein